MNRLKGAFFVVMGAASYGVLATFVKIAGQQGYTTGAVTFSQFLTGFLCLFLLQFFLPRGKQAMRLPSSEKIRLIAGGTSLGLTSTFYYLSVQYLSVSVCIILLMQTIWMGIVFESFRKRETPAWSRFVAIIILVTGTVLATGVYKSRFIPDWRDVLFGMLAAVSYTIAMGVSNSLAFGGGNTGLYRLRLYFFAGTCQYPAMPGRSPDHKRYYNCQSETRQIIRLQRT